MSGSAPGDWFAQTSRANDLDQPIAYLEEQLVIAEVTDAFFDQCDHREIGYPEKLANECRNWDVVAVMRGGPRLESESRVLRRVPLTLGKRP